MLGSRVLFQNARAKNAHVNARENASKGKDQPPRFGVSNGETSKLPNDCLVLAFTTFAFKATVNGQRKL